MKLRVDDDYENRRREQELRNRRRRFEQRRYVLVKLTSDQDWRWMFTYPSMEAYEQGGEPQCFQFKYVTKTEYESYRELGLFEEVEHSDVRSNRI